MLLGGLALQFSLMTFISLTPWGQAIFHTSTLAADDWLFMLPFMLLMFSAEEVRKLFVRRFYPFEHHFRQASSSAQSS